MTSRDNLVWVDGWSSLRPKPTLCSFRTRGLGIQVVEEPLSSVCRRRAFEPSASPFKDFKTASRPMTLDLKTIAPAVSLREVFPRALARLQDSSHDVFVTVQDGSTLLIPALLLIESLWLWSASAIRQIMMPGSVDVHIGRLTAARRIAVDRALVSLRYGATELRRVAWLAQCEDARRSWNSVLLAAQHGRLSLSLPDARLSAWAWCTELPAGHLVAELNGVKLDFDLPHPDVELVIGGAPKAIPPEPMLEPGFVSFM